MVRYEAKLNILLYTKLLQNIKKNILNIKFLVLFAYTCIYITGDLCNSAA